MQERFTLRSQDYRRATQDFPEARDTRTGRSSIFLLSMAIPIRWVDGGWRIGTWADALFSDVHRLMWVRTGRGSQEEDWGTLLSRMFGEIGRGCPRSLRARDSRGLVVKERPRQQWQEWQEVCDLVTYLRAGSVVGEKRPHGQQQNEVSPYPLENSPAAGLRSWLTFRGLCMRERFEFGFRASSPLHLLYFEGLEGVGPRCHGFGQ